MLTSVKTVRSFGRQQIGLERTPNLDDPLEFLDFQKHLELRMAAEIL